MRAAVQNKLEWHLLIERLTAFGQTHEGKERLNGITPSLTKTTIQDTWEKVIPFRDVANQGYSPPIGEIPNLRTLFKSISVGQILSGTDLRIVVGLLVSTKHTVNFCDDFASKVAILKSVKSRLYVIPNLENQINKAVAPDGSLNDDASEELLRIRSLKISLRKKIENKIKQILHKSELVPYLQDDFFTVRAERYVVPIRVDARGRVKGVIRDTSDSGQTLFFEPNEIFSMNNELQELDLAEKLEIIRIFRELSHAVEKNLDDLKQNYHELLEVDFYFAQGKLASTYNGGPVEISDIPCINLINAFHPLIREDAKDAVVSNTITLSGDHNCLVISGPNAGGKTVVLKTTGLIHLMAKAGLLIPADEKSELYLFENMHIEMGDSQDLSANLSTFSGHLLGLKPIVENATNKDLVLLDELATGTDPQTGTAVAQAILEDLATKQSKVIVTTHFDGLKGLALGDKRFRNGSMEFSLSDLSPTYKLILDIPGQSYGLEVADQLGFPKRVLNRAKELIGSEISALDLAVNHLMKARDEARIEKQQAQELRFEAESAKARWEEELTNLEATKKSASKKISERYEAQISTMRSEFDDLVAQLKKAYKTDNKERTYEFKREAEKVLGKIEKTNSDLMINNSSAVIPGKKAEISELKENLTVFVIPLMKEGKIVKLPVSATDPIEVEVGIVKIRVPLHDIRVLDSRKSQTSQKPKKKHHKQASQEDETIEFTLQTPTNSIDLRGRESHDAINAMWDFIDKALMRGESNLVIIHGHGENILKTSIRDALKNCHQYELRYRIGGDKEGGKGVTIVSLSV